MKDTPININTTGNKPNVPPLRKKRMRDIRRNLSQVIGLAYAASPRSLIGYSLLGAMNAIMPPISVLLGSRLVNHIALAHTHQYYLKDLIYIVLGLWIIACLQRGIGAYMSFGRTLFIRRVEIEAEKRLLTKASKIDIAYFDNADWHDRLARAKKDVSWRPGDLTWSLLALSSSIVSIILMSTLLASLHYLLVILAITAAFISISLERRVTSRVYDFFYNATPKERERAYISDLLIQPRNSKEIRAYSLSDYFLNRHRIVTNYLLGCREDIFRFATRISAFTGFITGTSLALAYLFVTVNGIAGRIDPGGVVLVIGAFASISGTLSQISNTFIAIDQHSTFLDDYFSFLSIAPIVNRPTNPLQLPNNLDKGIEFDNITFRYPGSANTAIKGLSLKIQKGELIALVGENGVGKTTLIKLLLRFYDINHGSIKVGGVDIKHLDPDILRQRIGVLFQDYVNYEFSIRENVMIGQAHANIDDKRVMEALYNARSDFLLNKMPKGLDSMVGRLFEGGHDLSGGEWQRLALARLMYRNADIWILDEPTSSLDPETEASIFAELKESLQYRIGIVISHRFSTVRIADRIAVIKDGQITEIGTHNQLLNMGGRYAELFELQASGYR